LSKVFRDPKKGDKWAVKEVSFEAKPGRVFGLLGVNGAGKTTLVRMLATLLVPTEGEAEVAGHSVVREPVEARRKIGFLSGSTALYGRLTARECLEYFAGLYGLSGASARSRVDELIEVWRIGPFAGVLCDKLSTGQTQRVSIARAVMHNPTVLYFDEPTSGLDVVTSQTVLEFIELARTQGKTVMYSTHIMSEAERLCDDLAFIEGGRIVWSGSLEEARAASGEDRLEKAFLNLIGYRAGTAS
jgi:sodium transport system ATP-binding protein